MPVTALELVETAAELAKVKGIGETFPADEAERGRKRLNALLESWSLDGLLITNIVSETFNLQPGVISYNIGTGQTFNTERPNRIISATVTYAGYDYTLMIKDPVFFNEISDKTTRDVPAALYYNANQPVAQINVLPVPINALPITIVSEKNFPSFATLATSVDLPIGGRQAIEYNLAIDMSAFYDLEPSATILRRAEESLMMLKKQNIKRRRMQIRSETALLGRDPRGFNIYSGGY